MAPLREPLSGTGAGSPAAKGTHSLPVVPLAQTRPAVSFRNGCFDSPTLSLIKERPLVGRRIKTTDERNDPTVKDSAEKVWVPADAGTIPRSPDLRITLVNGHYRCSINSPSRIK